MHASSVRAGAGPSYRGGPVASSLDMHEFMTLFSGSALIGVIAIAALALVVWAILWWYRKLD